MLTFHLAGINNQNFLMRDEETGSFWQQISGKAVSGPMKGRQLELVPNEELTFDLWRKENPQGTVLTPAAKYQPQYEDKDWEKQMLKMKTVVDTKKTGITPRTLMLGIELEGVSRAFPLDKVLEQKLVQDRVGKTPIILVVAPDGKSVRAFAPEGDVDFYRRTDTGRLMDSATGSEWDFKGCAVSGPASGRCLKPVATIRDYWFDWQIYHPKTTVYGR